MRSMNPESSIDPTEAQKKLESNATLHGFHWMIVSTSLLLTFLAWYYTKSALDARTQVKFDREADQVVELVRERMKKYEDALWGGVALIDMSGGDVDFNQWEKYAKSLRLEQKYPGINGIGVIHALNKARLADYLSVHRKLRPDFQVHPSHTRQERYPISYIIPVRGNEKAVGLDMAHEINRFTAAQKARDTGHAQITGPITLVQDNGKTPGFLFYAPFYQGGATPSKAERKTRFKGLVYAPFVVKKLMEGVLEKAKRPVGIRLADGDEVLYDELVSSEADYDSDPMFKRSTNVSFYGREWKFDIWAANSFREAATDAQPTVILVGGILIDTLLILLFISISRASRQALGYANAMTKQLVANANELRTNQKRLAERARQLQESNRELEQFAYVASHDLQEPLRKVSSFCELLKQRYGPTLDEDANTYINFAVDGAKRMKCLVTDLLSLAQVTAGGKAPVPTNSAAALSNALSNLEMAIEESDACVVAGDLPTVMADEAQLAQLFQNLISNAIKYRHEHRPPRIEVNATFHEDKWVFTVSDNGIGMSDEYFHKIFEIFKRLHTRKDYSGTGIGLSICKKIVDRLGGTMWVESEEDVGSTFFFTMKTAMQTTDEDLAAISNSSAVTALT